MGQQMPENAFRDKFAKLITETLSPSMASDVFTALTEADNYLLSHKRTTASIFQMNSKRTASLLYSLKSDKSL